MEIGLSIGMAVAVMLVIFFLFRQAELVSTNNEFRKRMTGLERDTKKLQGQLDSKTSQYQKVTANASKNENDSRHQRDQLSKLKDELRSLKTSHTALETKRNELSAELNRVRIDREELRKSLRTTRTNLTEMGESADKLDDARSRAEQAEAAVEDAKAHMTTPEQAARLRSISSLERDLERLQGAQEKLGDSHKRLKRELVKREANLREFKRRNEHNRRAYMITQLQLDLAQDEIYVLKHGTPPPYKHADKQSKRAQLKPDQETVKPDLDMEPIDLTGLPEPESLPDPVDVQAAHEDEAEETMDVMDADASDADELEGAEEEVVPPASESDAPIEASEASEDAEDGDEEADSPGDAETDEVEQASSTVRLRKAAAAEEVDA